MNGAFAKVVPGIDLSGMGDWRKEILGMLIMASFALFFYRFVYLENLSKIEALEQKAAAVRAEIARINTEVKEIDLLKSRLEEATESLRTLERKLRDLKERLPSEKVLSGILAELAANEFKDDLKIVSIKPMPPEEKGELVRLPLMITLESRFIPFGNYLERIENLRRIIVVDNFKVEVMEERTPRLSAQVFLSSYAMGYDR